MALNARAQLPSKYVCFACSVSKRAISTGRSRASVIPPESPRFIDVPQPPQRFQKIEKRVRGKLPVPRNLFPRGTQEKASPSYLDAVTKEPAGGRQLKLGSDDGPVSEHQMERQWKRKMADRRRMNLREGILELHHRQKRETDEASRRHQRLVTARTEFENAPLRSDEVFTGASVTEVLRDIYKRDQYHRNENIEAKRANVAKRAEKLEAEQADAIHTLYMHARDFITTEQHLNEAIEEAFTNDDGSPRDQSIWGEFEDADRIPMTTTQMLARSAGVGGPGDARRKEAQATERMKRVAEKLTGGKMDNPY